MSKNKDELPGNETIAGVLSDLSASFENYGEIQLFKRQYLKKISETFRYIRDSVRRDSKSFEGSTASITSKQKTELQPSTLISRKLISNMDIVIDPIATEFRKAEEEARKHEVELKHRGSRRWNADDGYKRVRVEYDLALSELKSIEEKVNTQRKIVEKI